MPAEPTRQQLSSRLAYSQSTPSFIQRLRNQVEGIPNDEDGDGFDEWQASSGRPPIPQRPAIPERPDDDPGSADEDDNDEKPQVVVLKHGKHMTALEAANEKRRAKGLSPIPDPSDVPAGAEDGDDAKAATSIPAPKRKVEKPTLSFASSSGGLRTASDSKKRKAVAHAEDGQESAGDRRESTKAGKGAKGAKRAKKAGKVLLSFGDGDDA